MRRSFALLSVLALLTTVGIVLYRHSNTIADFVFARQNNVTAAVTSVTLNSGTRDILIGSDITSQTTSLSPDTAAYTWTYNGTRFAQLSLPFNANASPQTDVSGAGRNGTLNGDATYTSSGNAGGAISFDGTGDYISFASVPSFSPLTMSVWVNPTSNTNRVIQDDNGTFSASRLYLDGSGKAAFAQFDNTPSLCVIVTSTTTIPTGSWSHIVVHRTATTVDIYVNGSLEDSDVVLSAAGNLPSDFKIGQGASGQDCMLSVPANFVGKIDEFQMYDRLLSSAQISQLYTDGTSNLGGPSIIKTDETLAGQIWSLIVTPVTSAGAFGTAVTTSNTVAISSMTILSTTPAAHALDISKSANISVVFSSTLNTGTVTSATLPVYGSYTGQIAGSYSFSTTNVSNDTVTFNPTTDFFPNEHIEFVVTPSVQSGTAQIVYPGRVYDFTVEVPSTNNNFDTMAPFPSTVTTIFDFGSALGDLNNDNNLDLILAPEGPHVSEAVVVFSGNGNGTFSEAYRSAFAFNDRTWFINPGDFNLDGNLDFVMTSGNTSLLSVFIGDGSFGFSKTNYSAVTGCCAYGLFVSDVDGDGDLDVSVPEINSNNMSILVNNGSGVFAAPVAYPTGTDRMLTIGGGDLNNDQRVDLIGPGYASSDFSVLLGEGNATFPHYTLYASSGNTQNRIFVNDINNDGDLDVISQALSGSMVVMNNDGAGVLSLNASYAGTLEGLSGGDFDADGDQDLVYNNSATSVKLRTNDGSGTFSAPTTFTVPTGTDNMSVGDVDNNGTLDIVSISKNDQQVYVLLNNPDSLHVLSTTPARNAINVSVSSNVVVVFDKSLNMSTVNTANLPIYGSLSGRLPGAYSFSTTTLSNDTVTFNPTNDFQDGEQVWVAVSTAIQSSGAVSVTGGYQLSFFADVAGGTGAFTPPDHIAAGTTPFFGCSGDFNGDGDVDLAVMDQGANVIEIYTNNGSGIFSAPANFGGASSSPFTSICVDINKDGYGDVLYVNIGGGNIGVLLSNGDDTFGSPSFYGSGSGRDLTAGDFNGDGALDIAFTLNTNAFQVLINNGSGGFGSGTNYGTGSASYNTIGITTADFNEDNRLDIAVQSEDPSASELVKLVTILGNGNGTFGSPSSLINAAGSALDARQLLTGDVNADAHADLIAVHGGDDIDVFLGTGFGYFSAPSSYNAFTDGGTCLNAALVDVDNDNDLDLFGGCAGAPSLGVAVNNGAGVFTNLVNVSTEGNYATQVMAGDFNGDGAVDGAIVDFSSKELHILLQDIVAPQVTIVQPNGGESISSGSSYDIIWRATDNSSVVSSVNLELTINDATYNPIAGATGLTNGLSYPFLSTWGSNGSSTGQFNEPISVEVDRFGDVYVVDTQNNRIQKFTAAGTYLSSFGSSGSGNGQFISPRDMAIDPYGDIYVTDGGNNRVQKFNASGTYLAQWGSFGTATGEFDSPWGIDTDQFQNVFVVDRTNNRVQKFTNAGVFLSTWGTFGSGTGQFNAPRGIAYSRDQVVFVADESNHRVQKFNSGGTFLTSWGSSGSGNGQFSYPQAVDIDHQGRVYVSDGLNHRVQRFSASGAYQAKFGSFGTGNGQFDRPFGLALDPIGQVYVADTFNHRIQRFTPGGTFSWTVPGTTTSLARIRATAFDPAGQDDNDISDATFTITGPNSAPTAPTTLYSNNATAQSGASNPTGLTDQTPAFSAICNDPDGGDILNKYRVQVDDNNDFSSVIWDSGAAGTGMTNCVAGARSSDINFGGTALALDGGLYYWRVKFWDDDNTEGAFSEAVSTQTFTMASAGSSIQRTQPSVPSTPTIGIGQNSGTDSIRWYFTDTANNETGFRLVDGDNNILVDVAQEDQTFLEEVLLNTNTLYGGRRVLAYNAAGSSALSDPFADVFTPMPAVTLKIVSVGPDFMEVGVDQNIFNLVVGQSGLQFELLDLSASASVVRAAAVSPWVQTSTYRFEGLTAGVSYQARVKARNQVGEETAWSIYEAQDTTIEAQPLLNIDLDLRLNDGQPLPAGFIDPRLTLNGTIVVDNIGSEVATNVFANLVLPRGIVFVSGSLSLDGEVQTAAIDVDASQANDNAVSAIWESLQPAHQHVIAFQLRWDEVYLRSLASQAQASADFTVVLQAVVSSQEVETPVLSQAFSLAPDLSVYTSQPPTAEPVLPPPTSPLPTPQEQTGGGPAPTTTSGPGTTTLVVTGQATVTGDQIVLRGTSSQPFALITLILNDTLTIEVVSDAHGEWTTFVDAARLGLQPGQESTVTIDVIATKDGQRSERINVGEVLVFLSASGESLIELEPIVSTSMIGTVFVQVQEQLVQAVSEQEPAIQTTLVVSAPVLVASSVPLWGYLPYVPTLTYHFFGWVVGVGARRKKKDQHLATFGIVYDSITKLALPLAIVRIYEKETHKLVSTTVTDKLGRYDILLKPGEYLIEVSKPQYQFPSSIVSTNIDGQYDRVYQDKTGTTVVAESSTLPHVPVDPVNVKRQWELSFGLRRSWLAFQRLGNYIATPIMIVGFALSLALVYAVPSRPANWVILGLYTVTLALQLKLKPKLLKAWGVVYDMASDAILPLTTVQLIEPDGSKVVTSRLSDYDGRFTFLPEPGTYVVKASKPGFEQVTDVVQGYSNRQQMPPEVHIEKPNQRISGDVAMKQSS